MTKKDKLFDLIKAMSPSEKRAFKIHAQRHVIGKKNNYVRLFDALDKMNEYDEKRLAKLLKDPKMMKYISADKYYLYNLVLGSLSAFHAESSVTDTLHRQVHQIELLFEKGLYEQAAKILSKARDLALLHDRYEGLLRVLQWERDMAFRISPPEGLSSFLDNYYEEVADAMKKLENRNAYHALADKMYAMHRQKGVVRSKADLAPYEAIMNDPLMKSEKGALSFDALRYFYGANMYFYYASGDLKRSHEYRRKSVELLESNPKRIEANPKSYIFALNNLMLNCILTNNEMEFYDCLNKIKGLPDTLPAAAVTHDLRTRIAESHFIHETDFCIKTARFEEGMELIAEIEKQLGKYLDEMDKAFELTLYNNIVCLCFGAGEYKKALFWQNKILNDKAMDMREDIICYSRVINLIIHFELENFITLPYLLKSTYRFLAKRKQIYKFEKIILEHMKGMLKIRDNSELPALFLQLRDDLHPLLQDPYEKILFEDVNLVSWLESRIEKRPYSEIAREKMGV